MRSGLARPQRVRAGAILALVGRVLMAQRTTNSQTIDITRGGSILDAVWSGENRI